MQKHVVPFINEVLSHIGQFYQNYHIWAIPFSILIIGWIVTGRLQKKRIMNKAQAFFMVVSMTLIYFLGDLINISVTQWIVSLPIILFGLWRFSNTLERKDWNSQTDILTGVKGNKGGYHWPGIFSCVIVHAAIVWMIWTQTTLALLVGPVLVIGGWALGGFYNPNLRARWIIALFRKPRYGEPKHSKESKKRVTERRRFGKVTSTEVRHSTFIEKLVTWSMRHQPWLDAGLNWILIPSWLPTFDVIILRREKLEIDGAITDWIPTKPDSNLSGTSHKVTGPTVRIKFKATVVRHLPQPYLQLADEDRVNDKAFQAVVLRYILSALSKYTRQLTFDQAAQGNSYEGTTADTSLPKMISNYTGQPVTMFEYIAEDLLHQTGALLKLFQVIDIDQPEEIEAAQKALEVASVEVDRARQEAKKRLVAGRAEGEFIAQQVNALAESIVQYPSGATEEEKAEAMRKARAEAMQRLTALKMAEGGNTFVATNILDKLAGLTGRKD